MTRAKTCALSTGAAVALSFALAARPATAEIRRGHVTATPYIELGQDVFADLNSGDVLTYSTVAAGIDVAADSQRTSAQLSYRYERRIAWDDRVGDDDVHTGLARVAFHPTRELTVEAGGIATRTRSNIGGDAPGLLVGNVDNISQVYSVYAGPSLATHTGPVAIAASYIAGYTKAETPVGGTGVTGRGRLDYYDDSINQSAGVSVGVKPGAVAPVGITARGG